MNGDITRSLTLANKITVARLLLVPVFAICLVYRRPGLALALFFVAGLADALDGYLARTRHEGTVLGAMLDPMADKLLMFSAYVIMGMNGLIPSWLSIVVISRDILISLGYLSLYIAVGFITPAPTYLGKITTVAQVTAMVCALIAWTMGTSDTRVLLLAYIPAGALTALSGFHYSFFVAGRMLSQRDAGRQTKENHSPAVRG
ncbi:MAG: CDP-alcohol phosphatidyltransferase family protein [Nitrospinota bacterium]